MYFLDSQNVEKKKTYCPSTKPSLHVSSVNLSRVDFATDVSNAMAMSPDFSGLESNHAIPIQHNPHLFKTIHTIVERTTCRN